MKKLDEIMELMADEMKDFEESLLQLKKMTDELQSRSIPISTEVMEKQLSSFFQKHQEKDAWIAEKFNAIDEKLKKAYILPKSLGIVLGSFFILLITLIGYLTYKLMETKDENFQEGQMSNEKDAEGNDTYFL